eukprot:3168839-Rhodomonas_salina.1
MPDPKVGAVSVQSGTRAQAQSAESLRAEIRGAGPRPASEARGSGPSGLARLSEASLSHAQGSVRRGS